MWRWLLANVVIACFCLDDNGAAIVIYVANTANLAAVLCSHIKKTFRASVIEVSDIELVANACLAAGDIVIDVLLHCLCAISVKTSNENIGEGMDFGSRDRFRLRVLDSCSHEKFLPHTIFPPKDQIQLEAQLSRDLYIIADFVQKVKMVMVFVSGGVDVFGLKNITLAGLSLCIGGQGGT